MQINTQEMARLHRQMAKVWSDAGPAPEPYKPPNWMAPVGNDEHPPRLWYCATIHDLTGRGNNGYRHTGVDLNLQIGGRGDVDRGEPVFAVARGKVVTTSYHDSYLGAVLIRVKWDGGPFELRADQWKDGEVVSSRHTVEEGGPLFFRYWHLGNNSTFRALKEGQKVKLGDKLGTIGPYEGGDHLHFDAALEKFGPEWWFTNHSGIRWIDPLRVLKEALGPALIDVMVAG